MKKRKGALLRYMGLLLMAAALFLTGHNLWEDHRAGKLAQSVLAQMEAGADTKQENAGRQEGTGQGPEGMESLEEGPPDYLLYPDMEMPVRQIDGYDYIGVLEVPSLGLELPVMSSWGEEKLKISPCRYAGSAYKGNLIIAGHNYRKHFSLIKSMHTKDAVIFTDMDGNRFFYQVVEVEILKGSDVERMEAGEWDLTLFTCTYGGQNRFTLRCEQVKSP